MEESAPSCLVPSPLKNIPSCTYTQKFRHFRVFFFRFGQIKPNGHQSRNRFCTYVCIRQKWSSATLHYRSYLGKPQHALLCTAKPHCRRRQYQCLISSNQPIRGESPFASSCLNYLGHGCKHPLSSKFTLRHCTT